ncbi:excinuclease ABC subunit UvrA, partial [Escherichia coli]|nr:excinuclease ABC subunit UvrA [Escherichia coli]
GVLYVLDEPSIGLHQKDNARLIETLQRLRDLGNSVLVVEHDEDAMLASDHIIDIGPAAGVHGGKIVATGTPKEIMDNKNSLTGKYLSGAVTIPLPKKRRKIN